MFARTLHRIRGRRGHATANNVISAFEQHVTTLNTAVDGINGEITSNIIEQLVLEDRIEVLRKQRERARKVRDKLSEFVV
jgi:uncharacterized protein (DUF111 family)